MAKKMTPKYYILKCRVHGGKIYSITKDDNICGSCAKIKNPGKPNLSKSKD